jgi:arabinogalactan oligomer/maltooligosaccharide transport system permease protein
MVLAPLLLATRVLVWHAYSGAEERALEEAIRRYAQVHRVPVQAVGVPYGSLADKLKAAVPRGHGPDLFIAAHDVVGEWSRLGLLQPLSEALIPPDVRTGLLPQTLAPLSAQGSLWGLPLSFKSLLLFYRPDLTPAAPGATDELLALCRRFREEGRGRFGLVYDAGNFFYHAVWLHGFGGAIIPPGATRPRLDTPEQLLAMRFLAGLIERRDIPEETSTAVVAQLFNQGRAATAISGPWFLSQLEPGVPYQVAPLPRVSPTGRPAASLTTIEAGFVNPHGAVAEAAAFLRYLVGPEAARLRALVGRQAVTTAATWQEAEVQRDPVLAALHAQAGALVPSDSRPEMRAFWEAGQFALRQVLRGEAPERALQKAGQQLDMLLLPLPGPASTRPYLLLSLFACAAAALLLWQRARGPALSAIWRSRSAYLYLLPTSVAMVAVVFVPFLVGAAMSLMALLPDGRFRFVGLANFLDILLCRHTPFTSPLSFYYTLAVTVLWTVLNVGLHVLIGGTLALLLRDPLLRLRAVYRMLLIVPWAVPNYITALIWKGMFNQQFGAVSGLLAWLGVTPIPWFSGFFTALSANVATNVWLGFPFMMVVALGNLAQIPREVEEAALLDGAGWSQRLRHIVLPLLLPLMVPQVILGAVWTFNMFNIVFLVSGGEPDGATDILVSQAYRWAFTRGHRYGYAAAYAVLIFLVLLWQSKLLRRWSERGAS